MSIEPLLEVQDLRAGYGDGDVLCGVDLKVEPGEIVAVLGSNGVGKSTLNRAISGVVRARSGAIRFAGAAIEREKPAAIVARGLIHVPEGRRIFPNLSVNENLDLGSYRRAAPRRVAHRERVFAIFPRLREASHSRRAFARALAAFGRRIVRADRAHPRRRRGGFAGRAECRAKPRSRPPCLHSCRRALRHIGQRRRYRRRPAAQTRLSGTVMHE